MYRISEKSLARFNRLQSTASGNECWLWDGAVSRDGYSRVSSAGASVMAHRVSYELFVGPIPAGHEIDHSCHNSDLHCEGGPACTHRRCVRPDHLNAVPAGVNHKNQWRYRKSHCVNGHLRTPENLYPMKQGGRDCRRCIAIRAANYRRRKARVS